MRTTVNPVLYDEKWDKQAVIEYHRASQFAPYIGKGTNKPFIHRTMTAITDNIPFVPKLTGNLVNGDNRLKGNEKAMPSYHEQVTAEWMRTAVEFTKRTQSFTAFDIRKAAKDSVTNYGKDTFRQRIVDAMLSMRNSTSAGNNSVYGLCVDGSFGPEITSGTTNGASITTVEGVTTTSADENLKDGWLAANADRVLFGSARANNQANDHSASLATIDTTDDTPRKSQIKLLKQMVKLASPKIMPFQIKNDRTSGFQEWYLYLVGTRGFGIYSDDPEIVQADASARERGLDNPLFTGGELLVDGVIIKQVEEMPVITAVGASSSDVGVGLMLGNQAFAYGTYQEMQSIADVDDYGFAQGLGIEFCDVVKKIFWNGKQHGCATHYFSAPA